MRGFSHLDELLRKRYIRFGLEGEKLRLHLNRTPEGAWFDKRLSNRSLDVTVSQAV